ncbi:neuronal growth regulator 1-like [Drosophila miranda]|uniref:neuronal growth regulator 1-like n=1 Tax=Drosophila miranda TaxID=7229 RepID=UPI00143F193B|nr:neuronal growth regulator 1-like [Drosophila miranda]
MEQDGSGKKVSWLRKKDYHLLTVGLTTYSSDERFSATHLKHSEDWTLQIKFVQLRDAGVYECQVSTHPPTSIVFHLSVVEARAEISGPPIRYLTPGSTLRLQCRVVQNTEESEYIFWYHDNRMINYDIDRGINVSTEQDFQSSELTIQRTRREHSGNFTCVASNTQPASVLVHIFKEARAEISGPPIRYLTPGSTLRLQCRVVQNTEESEYIFWYHDNRMINYDIDRGINVSTEQDFQSSELTIQRTRREHSGNFTCVASNTQPASVLVHIFKEARAEISGPPIRYLTPGSTLRLQCRVVQNTEESEYIFWYHDNRMINYDIDRGINVSTEQDFQSSELTIQRTRREHSGNFTCVASNTQPASVLVHIFKGDNPAAMYHGHVGGSTKTMQSQLHMIMIIIATGYRIFHTSVYMKIS